MDISFRMSLRGFLAICSTHKVPYAFSPCLEIPSSITIPPLLQGQATCSVGKLVDWGVLTLFHCDHGPDLQNGLDGNTNFTELLQGLIYECTYNPWSTTWSESAKCFLNSVAGISSCLCIERELNYVGEETPAPIYPWTWANCLNPWGAQRDGREQAVHQGCSHSKKKAAPTTLLLVPDEQLWSSHSLRLWDLGPKPRDLFQISKFPEEEVSKADTRRAHPEGSHRELQRALLERDGGCVLFQCGEGYRIEQKSGRQDMEEWYPTSLFNQ